jgi:hypothetical protein
MNIARQHEIYFFVVYPIHAPSIVSDIQNSFSWQRGWNETRYLLSLLEILLDGMNSLAKAFGQSSTGGRKDVPYSA